MYVYLLLPVHIATPVFEKCEVLRQIAHLYASADRATNAHKNAKDK